MHTPEYKAYTRKESPNASPPNASSPECLKWEAIHPCGMMNKFLYAGLPAINAEPKEQNPTGEHTGDKNPK